MAVRRWKVFLDTSALIAGIISPTGAAHEILRMCEIGLIELFMSKQVITEADRNISSKLPALILDYRLLMQALAPIMAEDPPLNEVERFVKIIHDQDAPILASAVRAKVDYLITWNTRHFLKSEVKAAVNFKIMTPGEFLEQFRQFLSEKE